MPDWAQQIGHNVAAIRQRVAEACARAGRAGDEVRLVGVTKYVGLAAARALFAAGVLDLGESRVQQLMPRVSALGRAAADLDAQVSGDAPRWHLIGHLQRNKVKYLLPQVRIVHSIDSHRLAAQIEQVAARCDISVEVLVEVNVSGEENKHGAAPEELPALLDALAAMPHIVARGLMTMAPLTSDPEDARPHFARLRELLAAERRRGSVGPRCRHLSMGMSGDYAVAVEEGATLIRVGSALFEGLPEAARLAD